MPAAKKKISVRNDPQPRPINAGSPYFELTNQNAAHRYVWVFKAAPEHGVDYYEGMGYEVVQYTDGDVKPRIGKTMKAGQVVESRGHVLMRTTAERAQEIFEVGDDGMSGQQGADKIEARMFQTKKAAQELSRRIGLRSQSGNPYFSFEAEAGSIAAIPNDGDE
jgi:hypothetical protein